MTYSTGNDKLEKLPAEEVIDEGHKVFQAVIQVDNVQTLHVTLIVTAHYPLSKTSNRSARPFMKTKCQFVSVKLVEVAFGQNRHI